MLKRIEKRLKRFKGTAKTELERLAAEDFVNIRRMKEKLVRKLRNRHRAAQAETSAQGPPKRRSTKPQ